MTRVREGRSEAQGRASEQSRDASWTKRCAAARGRCFAVPFRPVSDAPFAVGSDGTVYVNVTHVDGMKEPVELAEVAVEQEGTVFIGVSLEPDEVKHLLRRIENGAAEAVAYVLGAGIWKGGQE